MIILFYFSGGVFFRRRDCFEGANDAGDLSVGVPLRLRMRQVITRAAECSRRERVIRHEQHAAVVARRLYVVARTVLTKQN